LNPSGKRNIFTSSEKISRS